jgi:hypothetical protein
MKRFTLTGMLALAFLSGCASTQQAANAPESVAASVSRQQTVAVPATSAKKLVLNMSGPNAVTEAKDWQSFKEEWRATFAEHAKDAGIAFSMQEGEFRPSSDSGTLLSVYVNDYRMVGIGARIFFGAMTGNAFIDSKADFIDLQTGSSFGTQNYNTTSSAWHGVFAKMTPQQVDAVAADVFSELKLAR